ncbi:hypothetical protein H6P81_004768 [Aristolochia fimbriata]|uniref:NADP-dependent oxidoreductase domain-containing protein n=1 Tax=Aristolochia fimbriata TaxID=158543 RepID=A0AAV7ETI4_ARIFI|nr:hypothetical protein H6P81_004768 [Aristolochia fimbriata]
MEADSQIPRVKLGNQGLKVSRLGFGCVGLTGTYNAPLSEDAAVALVRDVFRRGITFFDTADSYGAGANETLVGKALKQLPREKVQLATKFGIFKYEPGQMVIRGSPDYVRTCCEASLRRLQVDYIDLYYSHRIDTSIPIEDTMGELKKLVDEGKVKYIGLSEASPETIRRAHAVHPITAVQVEWSIWSRDIEEEIIPLCRELGIGVVTYGPLGQGFFAGKAVVESVPANTLLSSHPRFTRENLEKNKVFYERIQKLAQTYKCTPAQLALAWVLQQGNDVVPIPGTTKVKNLDDNIGSLNVKFTERDLKEISDAVPINEIAGPSTHSYILPHSWRFASTPPKT